VALGAGRLIPLSASDESVVAFMRRSGTHSVLVIANLSATERESVTVSSDTGAVARGRWALQSLLDSTRANPLTVTADGRVTGYAPLHTLAPATAYMFDLSAVKSLGGRATSMQRPRTPSPVVSVGSVASPRPP